MNIEDIKSDLLTEEMDLEVEQYEHISSTVLVVDDDTSIRKGLIHLLRAEGYKTVEAKDGREALSLISVENPDLILLDLMMPDLDGMELLKLLRLDAKGAGVPVLVVSARSGHQDQLGTLQLGANAYICKPFSPRELVRQVRQLLDTPEAETSA